MGAAASSAAERMHLIGKKSTRQYRVPEVRAKDRFIPNETSNLTSAYEASIDKYDYLIVFPLTEGNCLEKPPKIAFDDNSSERITWREIIDLWKKVIPGSEETKQEGCKNLSAYWKKRTGDFPKDSDAIRVTAWLTIAREAIIDQLTTMSGLQLKMSANSEYIFCRLRAPIKLLELQADSENYKLQLKGEIDPGSKSFWNMEIKGEPIEIEEEKKIYTKDEANLILEKLYRVGKIGAGDLGVNQTKETESTFSRRVHSLERIADKVPISNKYICYAPFSSQSHKRYLYQEYPSIRGKTLFRAKDRLFLTKSILDKYFDCAVLELASYPVVVAMTALHDANRGDKVTVDLLQRRWVTFWRPTAKEVGAPTVTHPAYSEDVEIHFLLRPFSQPLADIRDYFGEKIGLFFAWYGFYSYFLLIPAVLGIAMEGIIIYRGYTSTTDHIDWPLTVFMVLIMLWSTVYGRMWNIECDAISLKWGTRNFEAVEKDRPQFVGDIEQPVKRSIVHNHLEMYYPQSKRRLRENLAYAAVSFATLLMLALIGAIFYMEYLVMNDYTAYDFTGFSWVVSFVQALCIKLGTVLYVPFATMLTDMENQRSQTNYEDSLISKTLFFELFNNFSALTFTAFGKGPLLDSCEVSCVYNLRELIYAIIVVRIFINSYEVISPAVTSYVTELYEASKKGEHQPLNNEEHDDDVQYRKEFTLRKPFEGTFHNYAYGVIQFGYVNLFSVAMPIQGLIALAENMLKIRTDAWKICALTRRPDVELAEDCGGWTDLMDVMGFLGIVTSTGILCFTNTSLDNYSTSTKWIIFLGAQQVLLLLRIFVGSLFPDVPNWLQEKIDRNEYVTDKWVQDIDDEDEDALDMSTIKGVLTDNVDADSLNLYDLRKGTPVSEEHYKEMERLEEERRELLRDIKYAKEKLQVAYQTETFNDTAGVGETKFGLPLGRLSVKLAELQNLVPTELKMTDTPLVKIRASIRATHGSQAVGPPVGPRSDSNILEIDKSYNVSINQVLGPFAPIKTIDAEVVFDVLDMSATANECSIATCSMKLRELHNQAEMDKVLNLKIRENTGQLLPSSARLFLSIKFEYSKIVPLRNRIFASQETLRRVERSLALLKSGKSADTKDT